MNNDIMVSICMLAYNHEAYIEKALASVLMQKTSFRFEIILHNDYTRRYHLTFIDFKEYR